MASGDGKLFVRSGTRWVSAGGAGSDSYWFATGERVVLMPRPHFIDDEDEDERFALEPTTPRIAT